MGGEKEKKTGVDNRALKECFICFVELFFFFFICLVLMFFCLVTVKK